MFTTVGAYILYEKYFYIIIHKFYVGRYCKGMIRRDGVSTNLRCSKEEAGISFKTTIKIKNDHILCGNLLHMPFLSWACHHNSTTLPISRNDVVIGAPMRNDICL